MNDPLQDQGMRSAQINNLNAQTDYHNQMIKNSKFGFNFNTFGNVMDGLNSIGQLWGSYQAQKLAKDQWKMQKSVLATNMMNQIKSYNTALQDRYNSRAEFSGKDQAWANKQYEANKLERHKK